MTDKPPTIAGKKKKKKAKDAKVLEKFVEVYCRKNHGGGRELCAECDDLLTYALDRLKKCPLDPKPKCKDCRVHCYSTSYRQRVREVMKFSGIHFVKRGRIDWLVRYFMG